MSDSRKLSFEDQVPRMTEWFRDNYDDGKTSETIVREFLAALAQQAQTSDEELERRANAPDSEFVSADDVLAQMDAQQAQPLTDEMVEAAFVTRWEHLNGGASHREKHRERAWFKDGFLTRDRMAQQAQPEPWHHADCDGRHACIVKGQPRIITIPDDDQ